MTNGMSRSDIRKLYCLCERRLRFLVTATSVVRCGGCGKAIRGPKVKL